MKKTLKKSPYFRLLRRHQNNSNITKFSDLRDFLKHYLLDHFEPEFLDELAEAASHINNMSRFYTLDDNIQEDLNNDTDVWALLYKEIVHIITF